MGEKLFLNVVSCLPKKAYRQIYIVFFPKNNIKKEAKMKGKFPTLAVILLAIGLIWFLNDTGVIAVNIPWIPAILIIIAIGMIINRYNSDNQKRR